MTASAVASSLKSENHVFLPVFLVTFAGLLIASAPNLADPMVRHDDFPALMAKGELFYEKTLHEGRWVNYWWHLRGFTWPAWANFLLYQMLWATFGAAAALNFRGRATDIWYTSMLAILIVLAPAALLISLWFNTLILGLALVALFAVLAERSTARGACLLMVPFVPLTLMAYTTYPLLLVALCLTKRGSQRSIRHLLLTIATFFGSFALGILIIYSMNWAIHGVFGVPVDDWRSPTPAHDLASALNNTGQLWQFIRKTAEILAFNSELLVVAHGLFLVGGFVLIFWHNRWEAIYIATGFGTGLVLLGLQAIASGISIPPRAGIFLWVLYCILGVRAAMLLRNHGGAWGSAGRIFLITIVASYTWQSFNQYQRYTGWQNLTKTMAHAIKPGRGPLYIWGDPMSLPEAKAAGLQRPRGLSWRIWYLTGNEGIFCKHAVEECQNALLAKATEIWRVELHAQGQNLVLPFQSNENQ